MLESETQLDRLKNILVLLVLDFLGGNKKKRENRKQKIIFQRNVNEVDYTVK